MSENTGAERRAALYESLVHQHKKMGGEWTTTGPRPWPSWVPQEKDTTPEIMIEVTFDEDEENPVFDVYTDEHPHQSLLARNVEEAVAAVLGFERVLE